MSQSPPLTSSSSRGELPPESLADSVSAHSTVLAIVLAAVLLRFALVLLHPFYTLDDSRDYHTLAKNIEHGMPYAVHGLRATRMPGYPVYLAVVYRLTNENVRAALMIQALLGGLGVWFVYLLASPLRLRYRLLAAVAAGVDPLSVLFSASLLSETTYTVALLGALLLVGNLHRRPGEWWSWVALGLVWSIATYLRASTLWCLLPLCLIPLAPAARKQIVVRAVVGVAMAWLIVFLTLLPWLERNGRIFGDGKWRLTTLEGISLYEAVYPEATGGPMQDKIKLPEDWQPLSEAQRDDRYRALAWGYIRAEPGRMLRLAWIKFARLWSPWINGEGYANTKVNAILTLWHVPLYLFAVVGLCSSVMPRYVRLILALPLVYFSALHALFQGSVRYRVPLMPMLCVLALAGVAAIAAQWARRRAR